MTSGSYDSDFPSTCDVLCLGTGLVESIVGAACSRIGKKVVVLDRNPYYGGDWATFNVKGLQEWFANYLAGGQKLTYKDFNEGLRADELLLDVPLKHSLSIYDASLLDYTHGIDTEKNVTNETENESHKTDVVEAATEDQSASAAQTDDVTETKMKLVNLFRQHGRRFNIALCSKILLARGKMVRLLVDSATSRYCEFLAVNDINFLDDGKLQKVPSCRADVFKNSLITLPEKRQMMRLLEFCFDENNAPTDDEFGKSFVDYLKSTHGISDRLAKIITLHILYESCDAKTGVCFSKLRMFCKSLGVYSNSPYLWTMYGVGELPQCFSRLNAIFGGTFILGAEEEIPCKIVVETKSQHEDVGDESNQSKSTSVNGVLLTSGQRITCDYLVAETSYVPTSVLPVFEMPTKKFLRAIFITSGRLESSRESSISIISIPPPEGRKHPLKLVEEAPSSSSTPEPFYMLQAIVEDENENMDPQSQIDLYMNQVLQPFSIKTKTVDGETESTEFPEVLLALYFRCTYRPMRLDALSHKDTSDAESQSSFLNNLFVCSGPDVELDFEACVQQAEEIFKRMYPTEEFLPKAPDPSDVIIGGESCETVIESGLEDSCSADENTYQAKQNENTTCPEPVQTGDETAHADKCNEDPVNNCESQKGSDQEPADE